MKKRMTLAVGFLLLGSSLSCAKKEQHGYHGDKKLDIKVSRRIKQLDKKLYLSDGQKTSLEGALRERFGKKNELKKNFKEEINAVEDSFQAKLDEIFVAGQKEEYEKMVDEGKKRREERKMKAWKIRIEEKKKKKVTGKKKRRN